jgi:hypothetical protein
LAEGPRRDGAGGAKISISGCGGFGESARNARESGENRAKPCEKPSIFVHAIARLRTRCCGGWRRRPERGVRSFVSKHRVERAGRAGWFHMKQKQNKIWRGGVSTFAWAGFASGLAQAGSLRAGFPPARSALPLAQRPPRQIDLGQTARRGIACIASRAQGAANGE